MERPEVARPQPYITAAHHRVLTWNVLPYIFLSLASLVGLVWLSLRQGWLHREEIEEEHRCPDEKERYHFVIDLWMGMAVAGLLVLTLGAVWFLHKNVERATSDAAFLH